MTKVKFKVETFPDGSLSYEIRSKSLTAALERAMLVITAMGEDRVFFEYAPEQSRKKTRHYIYIHPVDKASAVRYN